MSFNSLTFLIFIAVFAALWPYLKQDKSSRYWFIALASMLFYGWWDWRFLFLILVSGTTDYVAGLAMAATHDKTKKKIYLALSLLVNLGALSIFKYAPFLADMVDSAIGTNIEARIPSFMLILPVGISFYTFQSLSYTIDVYRGHIKPTRSFIHFFAFLMLFPQLVAGPIIRATQLLWRMEDVPNSTSVQKFSALRLIITGYIQKLLIADNIAPYVDKAFANPAASTGTLFWWGVMTAFAIQIYCDFAGYSNIARGLLKYMGWTIPANFRFPYFAKGFRDFWNRWHISLSHWFRDYVYIPLGGSRGSQTKQYAALWGTMLLSGLWHGANLTFIVWGALHAAYISLERVTNWPKKIPALAAIALTFLMTCVAWTFFRAQNMTDALHITQNMLWVRGNEAVDIDFPVASVIFFILFELYNRYLPLRTLAPTRAYLMRQIEWVLMGLFFAIAIVFRGEGHGFIYFQF